MFFCSLFCIFVDFEQTTFSSSTSSERAQIIDGQAVDSNTFSPLSSEVGDQEITPETTHPPQGTELLIGEERQRMMSSYENVYDGVQLDPELNRLSMDATQLDIGDPFDTKQPDTHLQPIGKTSSYEKLYEGGGASEGGVVEEGESVTDVSHPPCAFVQAATYVSGYSPTSKLQFNVSNVGFVSASNTHPCPVYITVDSGLDKLACTSDDSIAYEGQGQLLKEMKERSMSCEATGQQTTDDEQRARHFSTPDMTASRQSKRVLLADYQIPCSKGTQRPLSVLVDCLLVRLLVCCQIQILSSRYSHLKFFQSSSLLAELG